MTLPSHPFAPGTRPAAVPPAAITARLRAAGCVFAEDEARLLVATAGTPAELDAMVERRVAGLPLEHVLGWAEFHGLRISVGPGVFVPRRRTEFLAGRAVALARAAARPPVVVDLCCGSGALGAAVAHAVPGVELYAADIEPAAVRCARRNLAPFGGRTLLGDLFEPLPPTLRGRVAVLLANTPYVPTAEIPLLPAEARLHEPHTALDGGADGLAVLRRVAAAAPEWLAPGGALLIETTERQVPAAVAAFEAAGLLTEVARSADEAAAASGRNGVAGGAGEPDGPDDGPDPHGRDDWDDWDGLDDWPDRDERADAPGPDATVVIGRRAGGAPGRTPGA